ncbi:MAG: glycine cleavage system protein GcvH [Armatimonadetes bacterium]|nr:glycine cleavage system protein GcvH [Armatimonadota bacterium]
MESTDDLRFHEAHTWVRQDGSELIIGITDYAAEQLGDVVFIELPEVGTSLTADDPFGSIESPKAVEDLVAPISGEVVRRNDEVVDSPETVNDDPYGEGWLLAVKADDSTDLDALMSRDEYNDALEALGEDDDEDDLLDDEDE